MRLSLSAAEKLAKRAGPTFIAGLTFDRSNPDRFDLYVIELRGPELASVLAALRKAQAEGQPPNRRLIEFQLRPEHRLAEPTGSALHTRLLEAVSEGEAAYVAAKSVEQETLGYDEDRIRATLLVHDLTLPDTIEVLLSGKPFKGSIIDVYERRFGIDLPSDLLPAASGIMEVTPAASSTCTLRTKATKQQSSLLFRGYFFHASFPGPTDLVWRSKFDFGLFEITRTKQGLNFRARHSPAGETDKTPHEWVAYHRLIAAAQAGVVDIELRVSGSDDVVRWGIGNRSGPDQDLELRRDLFQAALNLTEALGFAGDPIQSAWVYSAQKEILTASGFCTASGLPVRLSLESEREPDDSFPRARLLAGFVDFGGRRVAFAAPVVLTEAEDRPKTWSVDVEQRGSLELVGAEPSDFVRFVDEMKTLYGRDGVILHEMNEAFSREAFGECESF
ncbi:hypothetical protein [Phenylobacterium immobile]|uniref:hypothetical protein n=1 Tax=Phenylobacterium immobile TaxID=21 RepID=UPI00114771E7|nr:hypothetical protein [Phenylobacterium immobile]